MIQILNFHTGEVMFEGDYPSSEAAIEAAVKQGLNLAREDFSIKQRLNLTPENYYTKNYSTARLAWANLTWANLTGENRKSSPQRGRYANLNLKPTVKRIKKKK